MENKTFWFPHDSNARSDENITKLRIKWGNEGYGIYWCLVELLRDATAMRRHCDWDALAYEVRCAASTVQSVVCDFGLFTVAHDGRTFWSESLLRRCSKTLEVSEKNRLNAQKRWSVKNATAMPPQCDRNATAMHSTVQYSTSHDSTVQREVDKPPPRPRFTPPTFDQVMENCNDAAEAEKFIDHFMANGWRIGKAAIPMRDWKAALRNWMRRKPEFQKTTQTTAKTGTLDTMQRAMDRAILEQRGVIEHGQG